MQNLKLLAVTLLSTFILIAGAAWLFSQDTQKVNELAQMEVSEEELVPAGAQEKGATQSARYTITEFSDFQCPACRGVQPFIQALVSKYPDDVRLVYRHFPLLSIHPHAGVAAQVAEAAGLQGQFWLMHDRLFDTQSDWSSLGNPREFFTDLARQINLDEEQFLADLDSQAVKDVVERDMQFAQKYSLSGTPTFFLNGRRMNFEDIRAQLESEL